MGKQSFFKRYQQVTIKNRIMIIFLVSSLAPFLCLGGISFYTINSILHNKVDSVLQSNLKHDLLALENTLDNLDHVSQQLAYGVGTNRLIEQLRQESSPYERINLLNEIRRELNVITFSNPDVGLLLYYYPDQGTIDLENFSIRGEFAPEKLPMMAQYPEITYYGPHISYNGSIHQYVFSTMRKVNLPDENVYLYIETGRGALETLFAPHHRKEEGARSLLILDNDGRVAFSENEQVFPVNSLFPAADSDAVSGAYGDYHWNRAWSNQGWSIVSVLPQEELNRERDQWLKQMAGIFLLFAVIAVGLAWLLWKMVYKPLDTFNREIKSLIRSEAQEKMELTAIPEFDYLLYQIRSMKSKIWELYKDIEVKEKRRADLEVETLLYQINPHFLMNTLDTVHWLAVMNGQKEIDKLVVSLNKLLFYNLGKKGELSTIGNEIEALKEYLQLQQIRYDFQFDVDIHVDEHALALPSPRFILQPLVENSLYHGVSDDGYIHVHVELKDELYITIEDNGAGMPPDLIDQLMKDEIQVQEPRKGLGIGMRYVKRILDTYYGGRASLHIYSETGRGTRITLVLPLQGEESA